MNLLSFIAEYGPDGRWMNADSNRLRFIQWWWSYRWAVQKDGA